MKEGDLVRFVAKDYGPGIKDQWLGLIGIISSVDRPFSLSERKSCTVLVHHPDDSAPSEVLAFEDDLVCVSSE